MTDNNNNKYNYYNEDVEEVERTKDEIEFWEFHNNHSKDDSIGKVVPTVTTEEEEVSLLEHELEAGDHVIRWTHVALYPIQIHGIVLETSDTHVILVDFGYTTSPTDSEKTDSKKWEPPPDSKRFHIRTLQSSNEIKKWSKVGYGGALGTLIPKGFNLWNKKTTTTNKDESNEGEEIITFNNDTTGNMIELKDISKNENNLPTQMKQQHQQQTGTKEDVIVPPNQISSAKRNNPPSIHPNTTTTTNNNNNQGSSFMLPRDLSNKSLQQSLQINTGVAKESVSRAWSSASSWFQKSKTQLFQQPPQEEEEEEKNRKKPPTETSEPKKETPSLDSDPKTLVLARVKFLLESAQKDFLKLSCEEPILPPYHAFLSNSECMAVWCKTGRWSTIQASIFLYSTAIGHGKQVTLGLGAVAALNPWMIPAMAGLGAVYVGAPYLYLNKCKLKWEILTHDMNDKFWAQAEPAVFIDCIHSWSNMPLK